MVTGLYYRFKFRSENELGFSQFSDDLLVGLGPLPSEPQPPYKSADEVLSSPTSLYMQWDDLQSETLLVKQYTLYMDDGFGVTFTPQY